MCHHPFDNLHNSKMTNLCVIHIDFEKGGNDNTFIPLCVNLRYILRRIRKYCILAISYNLFCVFNILFTFRYKLFEMFNVVQSITTCIYIYMLVDIAFVIFSWKCVRKHQENCVCNHLFFILKMIRTFYTKITPHIRQNIKVQT